MNERIIARAREGYAWWAARPWYVKARDRVRSEASYALFRLRKH